MYGTSPRYVPDPLPLLMCQIALESDALVDHLAVHRPGWAVLLAIAPEHPPVVALDAHGL